MGVTPNLGLQLPIVGDTADVWGNQINNDLTILDGVVKPPTVSVGADGTVSVGPAVETVELCSGGALGITRTLPDPFVNDGRILTFVKMDNSIGSVVVNGSINGLSGYTLINQFQYVRVVAGGGQWVVIGNN